MKKIIICLAACTVTMALISCKPRPIGGCGECAKIPAHNLIDCENYNDVFTVFWNLNDNNLYPRDCSEVLVCGYVHYEKFNNMISPFRLNDDSISYVANPYDYYSKPQVRINGACDSISDLIKPIINSSLSKKCYVKGLLVTTIINDVVNCCTYYVPIIIIFNVEDIYFQND